MLDEIELSISLPYERDMLTKILKPILASQAPRVSIIKANTRIFVIPEKYSMEGIRRTKVNIIPSKHRSDINKCVRCKMNAVNVNK